MPKKLSKKVQAAKNKYWAKVTHLLLTGHTQEGVKGMGCILRNDVRGAKKFLEKEIITGE